MKKILWISLICVVSIHIFLVLINLFSIIPLLWFEPIYISIPLVSFLIRLATVERECPLTIIENIIREKLGLKKIRTFIGHYFVKYIRKLFSKI